jgi:hypothetical protein
MGWYDDEVENYDENAARIEELLRLTGEEYEWDIEQRAREEADEDEDLKTRPHKIKPRVERTLEGLRTHLIDMRNRLAYYEARLRMLVPQREGLETQSQRSNNSQKIVAACRALGWYHRNMGLALFEVEMMSAGNQHRAMIAHALDLPVPIPQLRAPRPKKKAAAKPKKKAAAKPEKKAAAFRTGHLSSVPYDNTIGSRPLNQADHKLDGANRPVDDRTGPNDGTDEKRRT